VTLQMDHHVFEDAVRVDAPDIKLAPILMYFVMVLYIRSLAGYTSDIARP
jgi:hypothetical protein